MGEGGLGGQFDKLFRLPSYGLLFPPIYSEALNTPIKDIFDILSLQPVNSVGKAPHLADFEVALTRG